MTKYLKERGFDLEIQTSSLLTELDTTVIKIVNNQCNLCCRYSASMTIIIVAGVFI